MKRIEISRKRIGGDYVSEICIADIACRYTACPLKPGHCHGKEPRRGRT